MPKRISASTLNASTVKILNTIRANAPLNYQDKVPKVEKVTDIPKVGEVLYGAPGLQNIFLSELMNRIALVMVKSGTFNNPYSHLKKGYLEFGETVEEIFVQIAKVQTFDAEKAGVRRNKRTIPDVKTAFHAINWRTQYPVTIQDEDLRAAFRSAEGLLNLTATITESLTQGNEYDEYLLFKYLLIKAITSGKMKPVSIGDGTNVKDITKAFRATSSQMTFRNSSYNEAGVLTATPISQQCIFLDAEFNAEQDVDVLAVAFNKDKAELFGKLHLIDDFTTFDNARFEEIRKESDMLEEVTEDELNLMKNVKGVLLSEDWFQIYDNLMKFTEDYIGSGMYWNYWLNVYKTVSHSPFANAAVFVIENQIEELPASITGTVTQKLESNDGTILVVQTALDKRRFNAGNVDHLQTEDAVTAGISVTPYGTYTFPKAGGSITPKITVNGTVYTASAPVDVSSTEQGAEITFNK